MDQYEAISLCFYGGGLLLWPYIWSKIIGFERMKRIPLLQLPFYMCIALFILNLILVYLAETPTYTIEIGIYEYVERNGITVAGFAMAIAVFVVLTFRERVDIMGHPESRKFLELVFFSFLIVVLGVLPLYWIPQLDGWLTVLRNYKTIPYLYSLFILASAIVLYLFMLNDQLDHPNKPSS